MSKVKGLIHRTIGGNLFKFRFSSLTYLTYLKMIRESGLTPELLTHFETRLYLLRAALEAGDNPLSSEEVCELVMDEMSDHDQITLIEEAGTLHQPFEAIALDLRAVQVYWNQSSQIQRDAIEMVALFGNTPQEEENPVGEAISQQ